MARIEEDETKDKESRLLKDTSKRLGSADLLSDLVADALAL